MDGNVMKRSEIGVLLGHTNPASTRKWITANKLEATGRDMKTGEKEYSVSDVHDAMARRRGRGFRPQAAKDTDHGDRPLQS